MRGEPHRIVALDALRGFALLGILVINALAFALPISAYENPRALEPLRGPLAGGELAAWLISTTLCDFRFVSLFSLLFGAGLVLQARDGGPLAGARFRRRQAFLLLFGLAHAYLLYPGDILVSYAIVGFAVWPLRRSTPRRQLVVGAALLAVPVLITAAMQLTFSRWPEAWRAGLLEELSPSAAALADEIAWHRADWLTQLPHRAEGALAEETWSLGLIYNWRAAGFMLVGMALLQRGLLTGERPRATYVRLAAFGFGLGLPLALVGAGLLLWAPQPTAGLAGTIPNYLAAIPMALGWMALVLLLVKSGRAPRLVAALAAAGRMAFTLYIFQSLISTLIFDGHGLGLFGHLGRLALLAYALVLWALQVIAATLWLRRFRQGPLEWLWRRLVSATMPRGAPRR